MKKVLAGLIGGALILGVGMSADKVEAASIDELLNQDTSIVKFEGMAYREKQDQEKGYWGKRVIERRNGTQNSDNDPNGMNAFNRTHGRGDNNDNNVKRDIRRRPGSSQPHNTDEDDPNGMNAFNRTHGRGNDDGHDGMAWRERNGGFDTSNAKNWSKEEWAAYHKYQREQREQANG